MKHLLAPAVAALALALPGSLLAWGNTGHRMLGELAMRALPAEVPAFLRTPQAARDVGEFSREPDRSKGSGRMHGHDRDAAHFIDLDPEGRLLGGPPMLPLAPTRAEFETQLRAANLDQWKTGYLPYALIDRWQQLTTDLAYWRVLDAAEKNPKWARNRVWFRQDRLRREALVLQTLGELSHFVGDGSQPLHVTDSYNGWSGPNPKGYTTAKIHGPFESDFVQAYVKASDVAGRMTPLRLCNCPFEQRVGEYLVATGRQVVPFYELEKAGGLAPGDRRGVAFASARLAVGASELRDVIVEAWRASENRQVGWKPVAVRDVLAGKVDPYPALYGID
ncbi:MAG: S1/P1 Nuclease [Phenylobacterium sp.]|uniref:S1/P1 Nuclease n=1 Tax=Phenylobacterium sp. TaxID=1871053 RepID=UPI001A429359|nr:S1/P1 Nuclease [Phenylobacterium sp.]MBL8771812.1 S1/P1 Nuclease [Phenylobacterium sp.]